VSLIGKREVVEQAATRLHTFFAEHATSTRLLDAADFTPFDVRYLRIALRDEIDKMVAEMNAGAAMGSVRMGIDLGCESNDDDEQEDQDRAIRVTASEQWHVKVARFLRDKINTRLTGSFSLSI
jgi:hypothetical protein